MFGIEIKTDIEQCIYQAFTKYIENVGICGAFSLPKALALLPAYMATRIPGSTKCF